MSQGLPGSPGLCYALDMLVRVGSKEPRVSTDAYVAPTAVIRGDVEIGRGTAIMFGAVVTAEGGHVRIGEDCVIMENAVLRGAPRAPLEIGDRTLVGPHSHLTGCIIEEGCFIATGSTIFNGVTIGAGSEVRINGVVHVNSRLPADSTVPIGWVAVGDPASILPPNEHDRIWAIQRELDFPGTVFKATRESPEAERIRRYAAALQRQRNDEIIES